MPLQVMHMKKTRHGRHFRLRKWSSQLVDHGTTTHIMVVDKDRNVVSMTTSLNDRFGGGLRSTSTGTIIFNNVMADFSMPTDQTHDNLPPSETNFIEPNKRPLSSIAPIIVLKENQFAVLGMEPLAAVESPRIYHPLDLESVSYENWTVFNGKHFELSEEKKQSLIRRGHKLKAEGGAICQFVVHDLTVSEDFRGILTAVSDPRKAGWPEAASVGLHRTLNEPASVGSGIYISFFFAFHKGIITVIALILSRYF